MRGWFSRDYEPVATVDPGESVVLQARNAGWKWDPGDPADRPEGAGHALEGPFEVRGARAGHGAQGDGEVSGTAIECPLDRARLSFELRDLELRSPIARTADSWLAFGFDEDLDLAAEQALETMLDLIERELGTARNEALALASVAVDLRVTQVVNQVKGVHAVLHDDAIR
ncbi:MAG TPA: hypothetical protein VFJ91_07950 [Gaiellaceae bacterium]|nr:hypothetical protein [Gaiellaceae bacterium]